MRVGDEFDGGYLVPVDFEGIKHCFSGGVGPTSSFERHLWDEFRIRSFLADASVDRPEQGLKGYTFDKKFLGAQNIDDFMTMASWMTKRLPQNYKNDLILQLDIEGADFDVMRVLPDECLRKFRIVILEVHAFDRIFAEDGMNEFMASFGALLDGFFPVHLHVNNWCGFATQDGISLPRVLEISFLRKDRDTGTRFLNRYPHPLDRPNLPYMDDLVLPELFWRG